MAYTKEEFKKLRENDEGITRDDMAECAVARWVTDKPRIMLMQTLWNKVLLAAWCEKYYDEE